MVHTRLEKIGTIYTRCVGLIKAKSLRWEDRPLWFDIYEKFPPKEEPRFDRPAPNFEIKPIFYEEDKIRAWFHKNHKHIGATNLGNIKFKSSTQLFIDIYKKLEDQYKGDVEQEKICQEALELFKREKQVKEEANESLSSAFKEALNPQQRTTVNIDVKDIFKN